MSEEPKPCPECGKSMRLITENIEGIWWFDPYYFCEACGHREDAEEKSKTECVSASS